MVSGYIYVNVNVMQNYNLGLIFLFQISEHKKTTRDESMNTWFSFFIFLFITYHLLAWFKYARVQKKYCESTHQSPANLSMEFSNVEMESNVLIASLSLLVYLPCGKAIRKCPPKLTKTSLPRGLKPLLEGLQSAPN